MNETYLQLYCAALTGLVTRHGCWPQESGIYVEEEAHKVALTAMDIIAKHRRESTPVMAAEHEVHNQQ